MGNKSKTGKGTPAGAWFAGQSFHRHVEQVQPMIELDDALAEAGIARRAGAVDGAAIIAAWEAYDADMQWAGRARDRGDLNRWKTGAAAAYAKLTKALAAAGKKAPKLTVVK